MTPTSAAQHIFMWVLLLFISGAAHAAPKPVLSIFAAASMTDAMDALAAAFEQIEPIKISPVYASSSTLARQIEYGAPADLFVSANVTWMDYLEARDLIVPGMRTNVASNTLILVMAGDCGTSLDLADKRSILSALNGKRLALGEPTSVPAGIYAAQALTSLGVYDALLPNMVFAENVRMALTWVTRGEVEAGIVYASDLHAVTGVNRCATFPDQRHDPILYPIARIKRRDGNMTAGAAHSFLEFLTSTEAIEILRRFGFDVPESSSSTPSASPL